MGKVITGINFFYILFPPSSDVSLFTRETRESLAVPGGWVTAAQTPVRVIAQWEQQEVRALTGWVWCYFSYPSVLQDVKVKQTLEQLGDTSWINSWSKSIWKTRYTRLYWIHGSWALFCKNSLGERLRQRAHRRAGRLPGYQGTLLFRYVKSFVEFSIWNSFLQRCFISLHHRCTRRRCLVQSGTGAAPGLWGKTNGSEEWTVEPRAQLMDHAPSPEVAGRAFYWPRRRCTVITRGEGTDIERGAGKRADREEVSKDRQDEGALVEPFSPAGRFSTRFRKGSDSSNASLRPFGLFIWRWGETPAL